MLFLLFLIPANIAQIFISIAEIVIPIGTRTNEAISEIETQTTTVEDRISKFST